jgi:hypothetical protein
MTHLLSAISQLNPNLRTSRLPVYRRTSQVNLDPILAIANVVTVEHRRDGLADSRVASDYDIYITIVIEVRNGCGAGIFDVIHSDRHCDIGVVAITKVLQQNISFVAIPRIVSPKLVRVELACLVSIYFRDRGSNVR